MKQKFIIPLLAAIPLAIGGCATDAHYVQTGDKEQIISVGQINIQDYANAANNAAQDLLASGALTKVPKPPAVIFLSRIINSTGQQVETSLLTQKINQAVLQSGQAVFTSTDPVARDLRNKNDFLTDTTSPDPDFTLAGKIIETIDRAGNTTRTTYTFQLSLNSAKTGYQVWVGEKEIGKQGTRPSVGF